MAAPSLKKFGFFWGDDKVTLVEFEKNSPVQIIHSPLGSKINTSLPFSSNLTEEIQVTALIKKILQDNGITGGNFCISLPMKEIILRSFIIPFVKQDDVPNAIKFEAPKYVPFDIKDLSYVFHTIPMTDGKDKRLQVILFAVRKDALARYERIFKQVSIEVSHSEPYIVSLTKALLFRKEIKASEHFAFLTLDKNLGRICFIDKGIPQFIREFTVSSPSQLEQADDSAANLSSKITTEVGNSFDFYARQFNAEGIGHMLVLSDFVQKDLLDVLETELKLKITKFSPIISTGAFGQSNDIDAIYAMGACVTPPVEPLSKFNFIEDKTAKPGFKKKLTALIAAFELYKEPILAVLVSGLLVVGVNFWLQSQLKVVQSQYNQIIAKEGGFANETQQSVQDELKDNIDKLNQYKSVRTNSDLSLIIVRVASHLPEGTLLSGLLISYNPGDANNGHVTIDINGLVVNKDPSEQEAVVDQMYADFKNDKELGRYINSVNLVSFTHEEYNGKQATGFNIHFS